jgi:hypothetical protein
VRFLFIVFYLHIFVWLVYSCRTLFPGRQQRTRRFRTGAAAWTLALSTTLYVLFRVQITSAVDAVPIVAARSKSSCMAQTLTAPPHQDDRDDPPRSRGRAESRGPNDTGRQQSKRSSAKHAGYNSRPAKHAGYNSRPAEHAEYTSRRGGYNGRGGAQQRSGRAAKRTLQLQLPVAPHPVRSLSLQHVLQPGWLTWLVTVSSPATCIHVLQSPNCRAEHLCSADQSSACVGLVVHSLWFCA